MKRTISAMRGPGSLNHNRRSFTAENVDPKRSSLNVVYRDEPIQKVYHELFDDAVKRYNAKQKRKDRCITDYYEHLRTGKQEKLFHELIVQIGNKDDMGVLTENGALAKELLDEYMQGFQERNPTLRVFGAFLHMDEATPHLHIDFVPYVSGWKGKGLDTKVSLKQALKALGFAGGSKRESELNQWINAEKEQLAAVMERHGIEWEQKGTHEEHLSVLDFKKQERSKEVAALEAAKQECQTDLTEMQEHEPENHLHKSILPRLWDAVEKEREDCVFLYITHDLEFARSRMQSQIIWVKEFEKENQWQYELLDDADASDGLKLEILGNRQNVLLVEGTQTRSIDKKLYSKLYPEYNVISMESCNAVIQAVKTYGQTGQLHYMKVKGIVDRDRRSDSEVEKLRSQNIFVPKVAEVESLFLLPEVIEAVAQKQDQEHPEEIIRKVKERTIEFLSTHKNSQALLFTQQRCLNYITEQVSTKASTMELYKNNLNNIHANLNVEEIYTQELSIIDKIISEKDFMSALKIINDKGLLPDTKLPNEFGWKKEYYIDYVLKLVSKRDEVGNRLRENMRRYVFEE